MQANSEALTGKETSQVGETPEEERGQERRKQSPAVVFAVDENFALPLATTLYSLLTNVSGIASIDIYIIHPSVSEGALSEVTKHRLQAVVEKAVTDQARVGQAGPAADLTFLQFDTEKHLGHLELDYYGRFTEAIYYRLLMGELLPERLKKVIYLDSDLLLEDNVLKLWSTELGDCVLGAVQERTVSCPDCGISRWKEMGLSANDPFFNSGVMLVDLQKWRSREIGPRVLEYLHKHRDSLNMKGNQEGFNAILAGQWKQLPQRWNVLHYYFDPSLFERFGQPVPSEKELSEITQNPSIIHCTDGPKPWQPGCEHPKRNRFYHYLRESGWYSYPEYVQWRARLAAASGVEWLKDISRPYRRKISL